MNRRFRLFYILIILTIVIAACNSPVTNVATQPSSSDQVATVVAMTLQAITPETAGEETPEPETPTDGLLPHTFYYLGTDDAGITQVFRLEKDGKTQKQLTSEPVDVKDYDVSLADGSVVYVANNQLLLVNADGSDRHMLVDGGAVDPNNPILNSVSNPVFSPNGQTIAYSHKGLNLYAVSTGVSNLVLEKQIVDPISGIPRPGELYWPRKYSPDGAKLLITVGIPNSDAISDAIYYPATNSLVMPNSDDVFFICCGKGEWTLDSLSFHAGSSTVGMWGSGLWKVDASSGRVTTLIPGDAGGGSFNLADEPYLAPDGQLYFFFANASSPDGMVQRAPLQLVRSAPDGVTGRTILRPDTFELMSEALWSPDASFVVVAFAPNPDIGQGEHTEIVYLDGRPNVALNVLARQLKWGP
ncbi:MAG: hypothetical protein L0287_20475 [Anaerolineae bacterium]|nr:hypothetical protein [Anaerolineae bacterium]MCI0610148.1 hypothetical protein [Anaerolineae bacterium]